MALFGHVTVSDLSPQSAPKQTFQVGWFIVEGFLLRADPPRHDP
jgi:hypothetical protein